MGAGRFSQISVIAEKAEKKKGVSKRLLESAVQVMVIAAGEEGLLSRLVAEPRER
jgi:hypothetical protein